MKDELRKKYKSLRKNLSGFQKNTYSKTIFNKCVSQFKLENKNISVFIPITKFNEIDTWYFLNNLNAKFYLPVVQSKILKHIKYENRTQLKMSEWGILEPKHGEEVNPNSFDFVIVPLLAYDLKGNRVGYGAGFYDTFLKDCNPNCVFIGVSFFESELELIETYSADIPLHYCITPNKVYQF